MGAKAGELFIWIKWLYFKKKYDPQTSGQTVRPYHPYVAAQKRVRQGDEMKAKASRLLPKTLHPDTIVGFFDRDGYGRMSLVYDIRTLPGKPRATRTFGWVQHENDKNVLHSVYETLNLWRKRYGFVKEGKDLRKKIARKEGDSHCFKLEFTSNEAHCAFSKLLSKSPVYRYKHTRMFSWQYHDYVNLRVQCFHKNGRAA